MPRYFFLLLAIFLPAITYAQVSIRLFYGEPSDALVIRISRGEYMIIADGKNVGSAGVDEMIFISRTEGAINVSFVNRPGLKADSVFLEQGSSDDLFSVKRVGVDRSFVEYDGSVAIVNDLGTLLVINNIDIEKYIAAVVQAEGGSTAHSEYFKTQAVIARTYACMHLGKHGDEGYDLCDDVHCQVYHGRCSRTNITDAVFSTAGLVITDADTNLIIAPFHSNCGGETIAADEVWLSGRPYLVPVIDPYCSSSRNASWEKQVGRQEWVTYLRESGYKGDEENVDAPFRQDARTRYFSIGDFNIPFTVIRNDFRLRSSFFSIVPQGDNITISGKGYGHGVGLCQEGAMVMAKRGFTFDTIIKFYYNNVKIMDVGEVRKPVQEVESF